MACAGWGSQVRCHAGRLHEMATPGPPGQTFPSRSPPIRPPLTHGGVHATSLRHGVAVIRECSLHDRVSFLPRGQKLCLSMFVRVCLFNREVTCIGSGGERDADDDVTRKQNTHKRPRTSPHPATHALPRQSPLAAVAPNCHLRPRPPPPPSAPFPQTSAPRPNPRPSHLNSNSHPTYSSPTLLCLRPSFASPPCTS